MRYPRLPSRSERTRKNNRGASKDVPLNPPLVTPAVTYRFRSGCFSRRSRSRPKRASIRNRRSETVDRTRKRNAPFPRGSLEKTDYFGTTADRIHGMRTYLPLRFMSIRVRANHSYANAIINPRSRIISSRRITIV